VDMRSFGSRPRLDPQVGDVVTIVGREGDAFTTLTDMARTIGTIDYEIACDFSLRMPRVYV
ncbi:MAG: alanine racemase, partial [Eggerthellaceae bacterium]|nr:alanine racemase [Eggerthellaceae bacterium]